MNLKDSWNVIVCSTPRELISHLLIHIVEKVKEKEDEREGNKL